jgi:hypothetical protein
MSSGASACFAWIQALGKMRSGSLDFPAGNTSFTGEPVEVRLLLGNNSDTTEVEIMVIGS